MLSLREFCISLYLMERYREGHPLPSELPHALRSDEILLQATTQLSTAYGGPSWQMSPGIFILLDISCYNPVFFFLILLCQLPSIHCRYSLVLPIKGLSQEGIPGSRPVMPASGLRPPMQNSVTSLPDGALHQSQNMLRGSITERNFKNQHNRDEQGSQVTANEDVEVLLCPLKLFICLYIYTFVVYYGHTFDYAIC